MQQRAERTTARAEAGFSLLEMVVAVAIFTIVVGAIYGLLEVGRSDAFNTKTRTEVMQNSRIALNTIGRDAINAGVGYWKSGARTPDGTLERLLFLPAETNGVDDVLTPVVPGDGVRTITVDGVQVRTDAVTFVYQDNTFNNGTSLAVQAVDTTSNTVTVQPDNTACSQGDLYVYVIDNGTSRALGSLTNLVSSDRLRFSTGDPLQINNPGAASTFIGTGPTASIKRITWVTYFVDDQRVLVRRVYGNTDAIVGDGVVDNGRGGVVPDNVSGGQVGFVEMPLAYGVEDFQIKYVLEDGATVDDVLATTVNGTPLTAAENRQRVRVVQVALRLRGAQNDPKTNQPIVVSLASSFYTPNLIVREQPGGNAP
jgi:prepilin-type N-terminal cleavage/methylation domain-containing protein